MNLKEVALINPGESVELIAEIIATEPLRDDSYRKITWKDGKSNLINIHFSQDFEILNKLELRTPYVFTFNTGEYQGKTKLGRIQKYREPSEEELALYYGEQRETEILKQAWFMEGILRINPARLRMIFAYHYGVPIKELLELGITTIELRRRWELTLVDYASMYRHGNYPGGYIVHVANMVEMLYKLYVQYPELEATVNGDYVLTLIYAHDMGNRDTYNVTDSGVQYNNEGAKHELHGFAMFMRLAEKFELNAELTRHLEKLMSGMLLESKEETLESNIVKRLDGLDSLLADGG